MAGGVWWLVLAGIQRILASTPSSAEVVEAIIEFDEFEVQITVL